MAPQPFRPMPSSAFPRRSTTQITNWLKIKNPAYTQMTARHALFESRGRAKRTRKKALLLAL